MKFSHLATSKRLPIRLAMVAVTFIVLGQAPVRAQGQTAQPPNMQQMRQKLEQLEDEIQELKRQMNQAAQPAVGQPAPAQP